MTDTSTGSVSLPPEKQRAILEGASYSERPEEAAIVSHMEPFEDAGDPATITDIKDQVVTAIRAFKLTMSLPTDLAQRRIHVTNSNAGAERRAQLQETVHPTTLNKMNRDIQAALELVKDDPTYRAYSDYSLTVTSWGGVRVSGSEAFVLFEGFETYRESTETRKRPEMQWHVTLGHDGGRWKIISNYNVHYSAP